MEESPLPLYDECTLSQFASVTHHAPAEIEAESMRMISTELSARGISVPAERQGVVFRAIHASADFDYAANLVFSDGAVAFALDLLRTHKPVIVTDTNMALSGISKAACARWGIDARCFMADADVAAASRRSGLTRAACSVDKAARAFGGGGVQTAAAGARDAFMPQVHGAAVGGVGGCAVAAAAAPRPVIFACGNAPTALVRIRQLSDAALFRPAFVVGVPVGFVNVVAAKELIVESDIPHIVARGRKGGSTIAAAIINALLYAL